MKNELSRLSQLRGAIALSLFAVSIFLGSCAKDINARGNLPPEEALSQLMPGEQTRQDVRLILGTPAHIASFGGETWYYISALTTQYAFYSVEELERDVYALTFDERGILQTINNLGLEEGEEVDVVERETPTMGRDFSLIEQLIGNLGRFDRGRPEAGP